MNSRDLAAVTGSQSTCCPRATLWKGWLFATADVRRDMGSNVKVLESYVRNVSVPALTVDALIEQHVPRAAPVKYVQIDVEGWDDHVVARLPLGRARFRPSVIVFEWMLLGVARYTATIELLEAAGYRTCWDGQNVAAVSRASGSDSVAP